MKIRASVRHKRAKPRVRRPGHRRLRLQYPVLGQKLQRRVFRYSLALWEKGGKQWASPHCGWHGLFMHAPYGAGFQQRKRRPRWAANLARHTRRWAARGYLPMDDFFAVERRALWDALPDGYVLYRSDRLYVRQTVAGVSLLVFVDAVTGLLRLHNLTWGHSGRAVIRMVLCLKPAQIEALAVMELLGGG